ncbi:MAG: hypothetical protein UR85_C0007G0030 [Candidatus Nomurabacteria bacterium GW2011_GWF2_35_66]|uniref:Uncharacterized protein n=1 Tax=Candidatus Nomurabacteria bacterium GW2011_GWE1_35_16 TaxID=1618761 RepID=A0A0G0DTR3_9BACT|nr:MAG: hypothetical protein UR57_C0009G0029 [Candidatus Nomurabacteria bacterium GW2011_GWE2_34_25]KKP66390.1 MAG: hypothetical protein UR64_C0008G0028 [Candidatus Nomurabacteria bacterium GW2011_GWE1_35_16]KKP83170.1 MAG: hypothetical protein UR85_C0007G0030 [Candidatus Nomurabacteria bacterium GW2011_GWF2_35_66]
MLENFISQKESEINREDLKENQEVLNSQIQPPKNDIGDLENIEDSIKLMEDRTNEEIKKAEEDIDLYNIKNFSI